MSPTAVSVKPIEDYKLFVSFDNGEDRIFDAKPLLSRGPWFEALRDEELFRTVHVAGLSVEWEEGQDICPDDLYYLSIPV